MLEGIQNMIIEGSKLAEDAKQKSFAKLVALSQIHLQVVKCIGLW